VFAFHLKKQMVGMILGSSLILVMGVLDDIRGLPAKARLVGQLLAAAVLMYHGVVMEFIPGEFGARVMEVMLTAFWIIGVTNALNFLDGMDGLATGLAAISTASFLFIGIQTHQTDFGFITSALLGSCLGFLVFNFKPASIFLGDSGSTFLGFSLAALAVMGTYSESDEITALFIPLLVLGIIIYDVIFITIYRIKIGVVRSFHEWLEYTGRDHLHHRLNHLGLSETETVLFIYLLSIFMSTGAMVLVVKSEIDRFLVIIMALIVYILISVLMELGKKRSEW
jgi:UDP-GlcNAc:undecaprenyl-phosphate GlcNAc-1-phosphate transferase